MTTEVYINPGSHLQKRSLIAQVLDKPAMNKVTILDGCDIYKLSSGGPQNGVSRVATTIRAEACVTKPSSNRSIVRVVSNPVVYVCVTITDLRFPVPDKGI